jgi:hypothetical protein
MATRFNLFAQPPFGDPAARPEVVVVSSPRGTVGPGPSDHRMYVVDPVGKRLPYGLNHGPFGTPFVYLPPWTGLALAPALPDENGHFDYLRPGMPGFEAAHLFGAVRFTLDVWERYLGGPLPWHFAGRFDRLELSLLGDWDNAQYGYGFLEAGSHVEPDGAVLPFSLNFDVIAHEVGHAIVYAVVGLPDPDAEYPEYLGFQESAADCISLIAAMHFPSVLEEVLESTSGNLYRFNRIARISEFSHTRQMRMASNDRTMADFARGWSDEHDLSQPLTGAIFDTLVDLFHEGLVAEGLITPEIEDLADRAEDDARLRPILQEEFDRAFALAPARFLAALEDARDLLGHMLAAVLVALRADWLDYGAIARLLLAIDQHEHGGALSRIIARNFDRRLIGRVTPGPRLAAPGRHSHTHSSRTLLPEDQLLMPRMSYRERIDSIAARPAQPYA